jgi:hypothetical protein
VFLIDSIHYVTTTTTDARYTALETSRPAINCNRPETRQLLRFCRTMLGCIVPLPLDKSRAPTCEILKQRCKPKICHRKSTVSPIIKDHFGDYNLQGDDDMKAAAILLTYLEVTVLFLVCTAETWREQKYWGFS